MKDANQFLNKLLQNITTDTTCEITRYIPTEIGIFNVSEKRTRQGVTIFDWHIYFNKEVNVQRKGVAGIDEIQIIFCMNREVQWNIKDDNKSIYMQKGEACIYRNIEKTTSICYQKQCDFEFKSIQIPMNRFRRVLEEHFENHEIQIIEKTLLKTVTKVTITPYMYRILTELSNTNSYEGGVKNIYLESKVMELLAVYLSETLKFSISGIDTKLYISKTEKEAIMEAKHIIDNQIDYVPSSHELAKKVKLSTSKFTKGFTSIVGMPVHAYVIDRRLETAALLLAEKNINVSQAALLSGYSNMSHFSASFKKKYGVLPKDYFKG